MYTFTTIQFTGVNFTNNSAGHSVVYIAGGPNNSTIVKAMNAHVSAHFIDNTGTALHLYMCTMYFYEVVYFENNTGENGAALYLEQGTKVHIGHGDLIVRFVNNTATQYGGAIYADPPCTYAVDGVMFHNVEQFRISFLNNKAVITGNSLYFNIHESCEVDTNTNNSDSFLYLPYKFSYTEPYSTSIITSPHSLMLYFPDHAYDGSHIGKNTFFIGNKILGKAITFAGHVLDYCKHPAQPTQFYVQCVSGCAGYTLADDRLLVDNVLY